MSKKLFITLLLMISAVVPVLAQNAWELRADKDGIKVYSMDFPNSKVKALKVTGEFNTTPSQLAAVVMDVNTATEWVYHLKSSVLIKQVSPNELYYYSEVNLPWPAANRDFVAHLTATQDPDTRVVVVDGPAVAGFVPLKKGVVRINNSIGKWIITPIGPNKVRVEYSIHVDPGGSLPSWLVNMFATDAPVQIFKNLRSELQKPASKNTALLLSDY